MKDKRVDGATGVKRLNLWILVQINTKILKNKSHRKKTAAVLICTEIRV